MKRMGAKKGRLTAILCLFCMLFFVCGMISVFPARAGAEEVFHIGGSDDDSSQSYSDFARGWQAAIECSLELGADTAVTVRLDGDWTAQTDETYLTSFGAATDAFRGGALSVPSGANILLDLNGHSIDRALAGRIAYSQTEAGETQIAIDGGAPALLSDYARDDDSDNRGVWSVFVVFGKLEITNSGMGGTGVSVTYDILNETYERETAAGALTTYGTVTGGAGTLTDQVASIGADGSADMPKWEALGGGVYAAGEFAQVTLSGNAAITENKATLGGGIAVNGGNFPGEELAGAVLCGRAQLALNSAFNGMGIAVLKNSQAALKESASVRYHRGGNGTVYVATSAIFRATGGGIERNGAEAGAAIFAGRESELSLTSLRISENDSKRGAAVVSYGNALLEGVTINKNGGGEAGSEADGAGALYFAGGAAQLVGVAILQNRGVTAGGVSATGGAQLTVTSSRIEGNQTLGSGGGVSLSDASAAFDYEESEPSRASGARTGATLITGNQAALGGGLYVGNGGSAELYGESAIEENTAEDGGGIYVNSIAGGSAQVILSGRARIANNSITASDKTGMQISVSGAGQNGVTMREQSAIVGGGSAANADAASVYLFSPASAQTKNELRLERNLLPEGEPYSPAIIANGFTGIIADGATVTMGAGKLTGANKKAALVLQNEALFTMSGGEICENLVAQAAVIAGANAEIRLSGAAQITRNPLDNGEGWQDFSAVPQDYMTERNYADLSVCADETVKVTNALFEEELTETDSVRRNARIGIVCPTTDAYLLTAGYGAYHDGETPTQYFYGNGAGKILLTESGEVLSSCKGWVFKTNVTSTHTLTVAPNVQGSHHSASFGDYGKNGFFIYVCEEREEESPVSACDVYTDSALSEKLSGAVVNAGTYYTRAEIGAFVAVLRVEIGAADLTNAELYWGSDSFIYNGGEFTPRVTLRLTMGEVAVWTLELTNVLPSYFENNVDSGDALLRVMSSDLFAEGVTANWWQGAASEGQTAPKEVYGALESKNFFGEFEGTFRIEPSSNAYQVTWQYLLDEGLWVDCGVEQLDDGVFVRNTYLRFDGLTHNYSVRVKLTSPTSSRETYVYAEGYDGEYRAQLERGLVLLFNGGEDKEVRNAKSYTVSVSGVGNYAIPANLQHVEYIVEPISLDELTPEEFTEEEERLWLLDSGNGTKEELKSNVSYLVGNTIVTGEEKFYYARYLGEMLTLTLNPDYMIRGYRLSFLLDGATVTFTENQAVGLGRELHVVHTRATIRFSTNFAGLDDFVLQKEWAIVEVNNAFRDSVSDSGYLVPDRIAYGANVTFNAPKPEHGDRVFVTLSAGGEMRAFAVLFHEDGASLYETADGQVTDVPIAGTFHAYMSAFIGEMGVRNYSLRLFAPAVTEEDIFYAGIEQNYRFEVQKRVLSSEGVTASLSASEVVYNGYEQRPVVTVRADGKLLTSDDYDVVYSSNVQAGTARVTLAGKGNYEGNVTLSFTILRNEQNDWTNELKARGWNYFSYDPESDVFTATARFGTVRFVVTDSAGKVYYNSDPASPVDALETAPVGSYTVTATVVGTDSFSGLVARQNFEVRIASNRWQQFPGMKSWKYGEFDETVNAVEGTPLFGAGEVRFYLYTGAEKDGKLTYELLPVGEEEYFTLEQAGSEKVLTFLAALHAGTYYLRGVVAGSETYTGLNETLEESVMQPFVVANVNNYWRVLPGIAGWEYGKFDTALNAVTGTPAYGGEVVYSVYNAEGTLCSFGESNTFTLIGGALPDAVKTAFASLSAGDYYLRAQVAASRDYTGLGEESDYTDYSLFTVFRAENYWETAPSVPTWVTGRYTEEENAVTFKAHYGEHAKIVISAAGDEEDVYFDSENGINRLKEAKAGVYELRVTVAGTNDYDAANYMGSFRVHAEEGLAWWAILLIVVGVLLAVAIVFYILHEKGVLQLLTGKVLLKMRTRATIDATIAAVRANKVAENAKRTVAAARAREGLAASRSNARVKDKPAGERAVELAERAKSAEERAKAAAEKAEKMRMKAEKIQNRAAKMEKKAVRASRRQKKNEAEKSPSQDEEQLLQTPVSEVAPIEEVAPAEEVAPETTTLPESGENNSEDEN